MRWVPREETGQWPFSGDHPVYLLLLFKDLWRSLERKSGLFEGVDNLFDTGFLVIEGHDSGVCELIDIRMIGISHIFESPTDSLPGEGSFAVRQQQLHNPLLGQSRRGTDQDGEQYCDQYKKTRS